MCHGLRTPLLQRQAWLCAVQRLHLTLLVAAQHQSVLGRGHVQTHDVFEFLDELGITRDLEATHQVRLEAIGLPVAHHAARADLQYGGHLASAPVRGRLRGTLRGQLHQLGNIHLHRWRTARKVALDTLKTELNVALAPTSHLHAPHAQLLGDVLVLQTLGGQQDDACALRQPHARAPGTRKTRQLDFLFFAQFDNRGYSHLFSPMQTEVEHWRGSHHLSSLKNRTLH